MSPNRVGDLSSQRSSKYFVDSCSARVCVCAYACVGRADWLSPEEVVGDSFRLGAVIVGRSTSQLKGYGRDWVFFCVTPITFNIKE